MKEVNNYHCKGAVKQSEWRKDPSPEFLSSLYAC